MPNLELEATKPVIGMGLTVSMYSDRRVFTIISVSPSGKSFVATEDTSTRTDSYGMSDSQDYTHSPNPQGEPVTFKLSRAKTGRAKDRFKCPLGLATLGVRNKYHDFTF